MLGIPAYFLPLDHGVSAHCVAADIRQLALRLLHPYSCRNMSISCNCSCTFFLARAFQRRISKTHL